MSEETYTITWAEEDKVQEYALEMKQIKMALAKLVSEDPEDWVKYCYVSDGSEIGDFALNETEIANLSTELGITVYDDSYLWQLAKQIRAKDKA